MYILRNLMELGKNKLLQIIGPCACALKADLKKWNDLALAIINSPLSKDISTYVWSKSCKNTRQPQHLEVTFLLLQKFFLDNLLKVFRFPLLPVWRSVYLAGIVLYVKSWNLHFYIVFVSLTIISGDNSDRPSL